MKGWPPQPGLTDITTAKSRSLQLSPSASTGVPGLTAAPAFAPPLRMASRHRWRCGVASTWTEIQSAPASRVALAASAPAARSSGGHRAEAASPCFKRLDDGRADRQVRHEVAIHDVHVNEVGASLLGRRESVGEAGEVRGKDRGRDPDAHRLPGARPGAGDRQGDDLAVGNRRARHAETVSGSCSPRHLRTPRSERCRLGIRRLARTARVFSASCPDQVRHDVADLGRAAVGQHVHRSISPGGSFRLGILGDDPDARRAVPVPGDRSELERVLGEPQGRGARRQTRQVGDFQSVSRRARGRPGRPAKAWRAIPPRDPARGSGRCGTRSSLRARAGCSSTFSPASCAIRMASRTASRTGPGRHRPAHDRALEGEPGPSEEDPDQQDP